MFGAAHRSGRNVEVGTSCRLSPDFIQVVVIALDIARALERAHSKGVVHQDLHGGNILQTLDASRWCLSDFGNAAQVFQEDGSRTRLDMSWSVCPSRIFHAFKFLLVPFALYYFIQNLDSD